MRSPVALARAYAVAASVALILIASFVLYNSLSTATAQNIESAGQLIELTIDNGQADCASGPPEPPEGGQVQAGFGWANKLTPSSYPVTLRSITIGFNRAGPLVEPDLLYRIVVFIDPEMDGPALFQTPDASFIGRVRGGETFMTFNLVSPIRITEGSIVVGAIDIQAVGGFPALFDSPGRSNPPGSESFLTFDGGISWRKMRDAFPAESECMPGSWLIRATVETDTAETFSPITSIKDPLALDPFGVAINAGATEVLVTNYGSDNVTQIQTSDNSIRNVLVGDGPAGAVDGPAGVVYRFDGARAYVTLFGSETIPDNPEALDFSALDSGRVAVLVKQASGAFAQSVQINVGRGPLFPVLSLDGQKLYVPCAGDDRVDVINTATNEKIREIAVGSNPTRCVRSIDGAKIYVTNFGSSTVSVINALTDQKIKDIPIEAKPGPLTLTPVIAQGAVRPWNATVSRGNGNLYVALRGGSDTSGDAGIVEIDACRDEVVRGVFDETARPSAPTPEGAGELFGIAACGAGIHPGVIYTNTALGIAGLIDTRTDQIVSAPSPEVCMRPRSVACALVRLSSTQFGHRAYIACGQPDNSVTVLNVPDLPENIADLPVVETLTFGNQLRLKGRNFRLLDRVEVIVPGSPSCLTFTKRIKFKKGGTVILQKGRLSDGRTMTQAVPSGAFFILRLVHLDGSVRTYEFQRN